MPSSAEIHIQKMAPAPPKQSAPATPMMFPVPMAAARAAEKVWNCVRAGALPAKSADAADLRRLPNVRRRMVRQPRSWKNRLFQLSHSPVPRSSTSMPGPQRKFCT